MSNQPVVGVRIPVVRRTRIDPGIFSSLGWAFLTAAFVAAVIGLKPVPGTTEVLAELHQAAFRGLAGLGLIGAAAFFAIAYATKRTRSRPEPLRLHLKKGA